MIVEGYGCPSCTKGTKDCPSCVNGCPPGQDNPGTYIDDPWPACAKVFDPGYGCKDGTCSLINMPAHAPTPDPYADCEYLYPDCGSRAAPFATEDECMARCKGSGVVGAQDGCPPGQGKWDTTPPLPPGEKGRAGVPHGCIKFFDPGYACNNGTCSIVNMPAKASGPGQAPYATKEACEYDCPYL